jgi:hypothetical protein
MRFMILLKSDADTEAGVMPDPSVFEEMGKFNEELVKAGAMLAGEGLQPSSKGARISFKAGSATVTDGPFAEAKELIAGFWIIQAKSKEEAIEWAKRAPLKDAEVEVRQVFENEDFGDALPPEVLDQEERLRAQIAEQHGA